MPDPRLSATAVLVICLALPGCGNAPLGIGGMARAGKGEACTLAEVTARVAAIYRPETTALKTRIKGGDYSIRADDVDGLAAGMAYVVSAPEVTAARPSQVDCTAQLAVSSSQYGVTDQPPATIRYRIVPADGTPDYRILPIDSEGKAAAQAVFQQIIAKMDGTLATTDENAAASTLGAINTPAVSDDPLDRPRENESEAVPTR